MADNDTADYDYTFKTELKDAWSDGMGHINHAYYLSLGEQARWAWATELGVGKSHIEATGVGWVILEAHVKYLKELRANEQIHIGCKLMDFKHKVGRIKHDVYREHTLCAVVEVVFGFFDLKQRKLVPPDDTLKQTFGIA